MYLLALNPDNRLGGESYPAVLQLPALLGRVFHVL